jgi:NitT/TauT family transport system permease protein
MGNWRHWVLPLFIGVVLLACWVGIKAFWDLPAYILPGPGEVLDAAAAERETLLAAAKDTFAGALIGFLAAGSVGFLMAMVLASSNWLRTALHPWIVFLQMIPVIILVPIFVLWFGPGLVSVILITFMISFFPVVANTTQGLISVRENHLDLFRMGGAGPLQEMFLLRVPASLPYFFTGLKIAATLAVIGALTGELFAGSATGSGGLGFLVIIYKAQLKIPELFATAATACGLGFLFVGAVSRLKWLFLHKWHESMEHHE